jgi:hypothetical protein
MKHALLPIASSLLLLLLVACGNPALNSAGRCEPKSSEKPENQSKQLTLAGETGGAPLAHLPGGFLVYDEIGLETFITTGDLAKSMAPNRKCSALLIPRVREGRAYFDVTSAESCLRPFVWGALNQRILLSIPGTTDYQEFKIKDARVLAVPSLFALMAPLPEKVRKRAVGASTVERIEAEGYYTQDYKGWEYNSPEEISFLAAQCAENNKVTPVPENCLWFNGHMPDSIEVELGVDNKQAFESLAAASLAFEQASTKKLDQVYPALGKRISDYNANMQSFQPFYDEIVLSAMSTYWIGCKDSVARDTCYGTTLEQRKAFATSLVKLYRPSRVTEFEAAFAATDPVAARDALDEKYDRLVVEGVKAHFAPAVESYYEFRKEFVRRQDLISILSNHLEGTKLEPEKIGYRALTPFSSKVPEPLKGIVFSFKDGNVLMTHPGAQANQNLALDGHIGSVFAFGGLPVLGFGPSNIDQSDATSVMPIPRTKTKATRPEGSSTSTPPTDSSKTTTGEGKSGDRC